LHVVWPTLAVTGVPTGCPDSAVAEQFQPAAEAEADMTAALAVATTAITIILRTRALQSVTRFPLPVTTPGDETSGFPCSAGD
jgi:hypothetical protein